MTMPDWHMPWLLLIALQPMVVILFRRLFERNNLNKYAQASLQPWVSAQNKTHHINYSFIRNIAYWLAWVLFAIAAAGPRIAEDTSNALTNNGKDIMVVLDISQSMQATDLNPSRLRQAHKKINHLVNALPTSRIGLIVYAARPHLYIPMTYDKDALQFYLRNLELLTPPSQGTRPSRALALASNELSNEKLTNTQRAKYILHITDADTDEKENKALEDISSILSEKKIPVYTLLMASDKGEAIPAFKDGWLNIDGRPVVSRPNIPVYRALSNKTDGYFAKSFDDNSGINTLVENIKTDKRLLSKNNTSHQTNWNELFPVFLLAGILFLVVSMSPYKLIAKISPRASSSLLVIFVLLGSFASTDVAADQQDTLQKAYQALINEDFLKARQLYSSLNNFPGRYGEAVAAYRMADYPRAIRLFEQAVLIAQSTNDYTNTLYNLGNSYFQSGNFQVAITSYQGALLYNPEHQASKYNIAYARKALLAVEERKKILAITTRAGRGPRSARAADNIVINENSGVSLDESESSSNDSTKTRADSDLDIPEFIILKGLAFAEKSGTNKTKINNNSEKPLSAASVSSQLDKLYDNQPALWRRIFEIEEGYPAPLEEPDKVPGVLPW